MVECKYLAQYKCKTKQNKTKTTLFVYLMHLVEANFNECIFISQLQYSFLAGHPQCSPVMNKIIKISDILMESRL